MLTYTGHFIVTQIKNGEATQEHATTNSWYISKMMQMVKRKCKNHVFHDSKVTALLGRAEANCFKSISSIRRSGYYSRAWTIRVRRLFFFGKPADINDGWINSVRAIQGRRLDAVRSKRSLLVLLSALVEPLAKILGEELGQHSICITSRRIQEHRSRMIGHSPFVLVWFWLSRFVMATLAAVLEPKICLQGKFASQ